MALALAPQKLTLSMPCCTLTTSRAIVVSKGSTGNLHINPVSTERAAVVISAEESGGKLVRAELWAPPGARVAAPHVHPGQSERFEVLEGRLGVRYGDTTSVALPGDSRFS